MQNPPIRARSQRKLRGMGVWDGVWDRLTELFTVAQFDLPAPDLDKTDNTREIFRNYARMCVEVAAALGHERFHIFGWTGGTHVAIHALIAYPQHIVSCVLLGPVCALPDNRSVEQGMGVQRMLLDKSLEDYTYSWILSGVSWDYTLENYDRIEAIVRDRMAADKGRLDTERVFKWIRALRFPSYTEAELDGISTPTFIAVQSFDRWPSLAMARRLHGLIPDSELAVIHGGGSLVLMEAPEKFMAAAGRFLRAAAAGTIAPARVLREDHDDLLSGGLRTGVVEQRPAGALGFLHGWLSRRRCGRQPSRSSAMRCAAWRCGNPRTGLPPRRRTSSRWTSGRTGLPAICARWALRARCWSGIRWAGFCLRRWCGAIRNWSAGWCWWASRTRLGHASATKIFARVPMRWPRPGAPTWRAARPSACSGRACWNANPVCWEAWTPMCGAMI